jgi:hypothetical protein
MNERIVKLITEADAYAWTIAEKYVPECGEVNYLWEDAFRKKFAELIVKECMEQVWYTREDGINGNVSEVIKDRIKQHFGVEE